MRIVTPAPLSVVAVAAGAGPHRGVADEKEHGVVALPRTACHGTGGLREVERVGSIVNHAFVLCERSLWHLRASRPGHPRALFEQNRVQEHVLKHCGRLDFRPLYRSSPEFSVEFASEIESHLGRLVVAYVLRGYRCAVDGIFKESMETVFSRYGADIETQLAVVFGAQQHLLPPVAEEISGNRRVGLGAVVACRPLEGDQILHEPGLGVELVDVVAVKQFAGEVSVPPYSEILRCGLDGYGVTAEVAHAS